MVDYDSKLENYQATQQRAQPTGVTGKNKRDDSNADWSHRTEMAEQGDIQYDEQLTVSQAINERKAGKLLTIPPSKPDWMKQDPSEQGEVKSTAQRYRERYGHYWSDEMKEKAFERFKNESNN